MPFLMELKLPAWIVLLMVIVSSIIILYYKYIIQIKIAKLQNTAKEKEIQLEMITKLTQDRFTKTLEALEDINRLIMEFYHGVRHFSQGNFKYKDDIELLYTEIRKKGRAYELLLSSVFYQVILSFTDIGKTVLNSNSFNLDKFLDEWNNIKILINNIQSTIPKITSSY